MWVFCNSTHRDPFTSISLTWGNGDMGRLTPHECSTQTARGHPAVAGRPSVQCDLSRLLWPAEEPGPATPPPRPHPRHHRQFQVAICFQSLSSQAQASATVPTQILGNTCQLFQMFLLKHHPLTQSASRGTPRPSKGILIA